MNKQSHTIQIYDNLASGDKNNLKKCVTTNVKYKIFK